MAAGGLVLKQPERSAVRTRSLASGRQWPLAWLMVLPAAVVLGVFHLFPIAYLAYVSLWKWGINQEAFLGLDNYLELFRDADFGLAFLQTIYFVIGTVPIQMALALVIATLLSRRIKGRALYRLAYFMPYITSTVAVGVIWRWIFNSAGFANYLMRLVGLPLQKWLLQSDGILTVIFGHFGVAIPAWLGGPSQALVAIIIASIWSYLGFQVVLFLAGLTTIPQETYEAARIDGANERQLFRWITLPLLGPTISFVAVISTIFAFRSFNQIYIMSQPNPGGPLNSTTLATIFVFNGFYKNNRVGYAAAASLILFAVILLMTLSRNRNLRVTDA